MKNLNNMHEETGLAGKALNALGNKLAEIAVDPRGCWGVAIYEPELSPNMIEEMLNSD